MLSEIVAVRITTHRKPIIIAACYRPPKNSISDLKQLTTELQDLSLIQKQNNTNRCLSDILNPYLTDV